MLGWQGDIASAGYLVALQTQAPLIINDPGYVFERWHGTLLIIAVAALSVSFNIFFPKKLPFIEGFMLFIHLCGFSAILIPLWTLAPAKTPASIVFTKFDNNGGWPSMGLPRLIGITGPVSSFIGSDSAVHMGRSSESESSPYIC